MSTACVVGFKTSQTLKVLDMKLCKDMCDMYYVLRGLLVQHHSSFH